MTTTDNRCWAPKGKAHRWHDGNGKRFLCCSECGHLEPWTLSDVISDHDIAGTECHHFDRPPTTTEHFDMPSDDEGKPLAWQVSDGSWADAWNGIYVDFQTLTNEIKDWSADLADRVLDYGENPITEDEANERRSGTTQSTSR